jgi:uncharacterized protein YegL
MSLTSELGFFTFGRSSVVGKGSEFDIVLPPPINLTVNAERTMANGSYEISVTAFSNGTRNRFFGLRPVFSNPAISIISNNLVVVQLRQAFRPTLTLTAEAVSGIKINISVAARVNNFLCPYTITSYIVSATNAADNAVVVSKTYSSIPQGEVLSGFNPSTSYRIVVTAQTGSAAIGTSRPMIVTTLSPVCDPVCVTGTCNVTTGECVCPPGYCGEDCSQVHKKDLVFLLDYSNSITKREFAGIQRTVRGIIEHLNIIGPNNTRVGVILFANQAVRAIRLKDSTNKADLLQQVASLGRLKRKSGTRTALALTKAESMFSKEGRSDVEQCIILITDGRATDPRQLPAVLRRLNMKNIDVINTIGIGNRIYRKELIMIAGGKSEVLVKPSSNELQEEIAMKIEAMSCP